MFLCFISKKIPFNNSLTLLLRSRDFQRRIRKGTNKTQLIIINYYAKITDFYNSTCLSLYPTMHSYYFLRRSIHSHPATLIMYTASHLAAVTLQNPGIFQSQYLYNVTLKTTTTAFSYEVAVGKGIIM